MAIAFDANSSTNIEIKEARNQALVPVVEGIHLHSIYNPIREAESFIAKNDDALKTQNRVLVFGLGFGYHVAALEQLLSRYHQNWQIYVIEPEPKMVQLFNTKKPCELSEKTHIISATQINEVYDNMDLIRFMAEKPLVIAHPATFNLREGYFKNFMSYEASNRIDAVASKVQDYDLSNYIKTLGEDHDDFIEAVNFKLNSGDLNHHDYLLGIFATISGNGESV